MSLQPTSLFLSGLGIVTGCCLLAGCGSSEKITTLSDGFELARQTPNSLMESGHDALELRYRDTNGKPVVVWSCLESDVFQKNGVSVFLAQKYYIWDDLDKHWGQESRVFAVKPAELPVDISTEIVGRWAKASGRDAGTVSTNLFNDGIMDVKTEGDHLTFHFDQSDPQASDATDIAVDWNQIEDMIQSVKAKGVTHKDPELGTTCYEMEFDPAAKK